MTYPIVIVERHAEFTEATHLATTDESEDVSCKHPAAPAA